MINLIPNEEKKKKRKDFYFRLLVTAFTVFGFSTLIAAAALLPAYFLSVVKKNLISEKVEAQKNEPVPLLDQKTLDLVKYLGNKLSLVEKSRENQYSISKKVLNEILSEKMPVIKITLISFQNDPSGGKTVNVNGSAASREALLAFKRALEDNPAFKKVDLPISNFIRGSNIQFSLNLVPA